MQDEFYIWGYQPHFRVAAEAAAGSLFRSIDPKLAPSVAIWGVKCNANVNGPLVCVEPADCEIAKANFERVRNFSRHFRKHARERHYFHSHPIAQERHETGMDHAALGQALKYVIDGAHAGSERATFLTSFVEINGYWTCLVLQLDKFALETHPHLERSTSDGMRVYTSLTDAAVSQYLEDWYVQLTTKDPGIGWRVSRDESETLRLAGARLMYTPALAGGDFQGLHGAFQACNVIAGMTYEGAPNTGSLLFCNNRHPNLIEELAFRDPVDLRNYKAIRKLLEIASDELHLLCDSAHVYGLGRIDDLYNHAREDAFTVRFLNTGTWELEHNRFPLMRVNHGTPQLPRPDERFDKLREICQRVLGDPSVNSVRRIAGLVRAAAMQRNGTLIVIAIDAAAEADRFGSQCVRIEPTPLSEGLVSAITSVDGAVLVDRDSQCYAFGVILDGPVTPLGTSGRGARYNSALRYIQGRATPAVAVVVSEDGYFDILPDLRPQVSRAEIQDKIRALTRAAEDDPVNVREFCELMQWCHDSRFYLDSKQCDEVNRAYRGVDANRPVGWVWRIYRPFEPNAEMNDSYLSD